MDDDFSIFIVIMVALALLLLPGCSGSAGQQIAPVPVYAAYSPCAAPLKPHLVELVELGPDSHLGGDLNAALLHTALDEILFYTDALEDALGCYQAQTVTGAEPENLKSK